MQQGTQTYPIGITKLAKYLATLKGPRTLETLVNNKKVMFLNLTTMDELAITKILQDLQYGKVYFIPKNGKKVRLIRTGNSNFVTDATLARQTATAKDLT